MKKLSLIIVFILIIAALSCFAWAEDTQAFVEVSSNISGADVYVDGVLYEPAVAPCTVPVTAGEHDIRVSVIGYKDFEKHVSLSSGQTGQVEAVLKADIPSGDGVRVITVSRSDDYPEFACYEQCSWDTYERFIINKQDNWAWDDPEKISYAYEYLTNWGADNTGVTLRLAMTIIMNDTGYYDEENQIPWQYVVEFAENVTCCAISKDIICYGRGYAEYADGKTLPSTDGTYDMVGNYGGFTINGDKDGDGIADVTLKGKESYGWDGCRRIQFLCSDVRFNGLIVDKTFHISLGMPFGQPKFYVNLHDVYLSGCTFKPRENGVSRFFTEYYGTYGHGSEHQGDYGTWDLDGLSFSNCSFTRDRLGIIAACGDIDYCSMRNLTIQANHLIDGQIFVRNVDGHTWYMWGQNSEFGSNYDPELIGVAEHNTLSDVVISGNYMEFTDDVLSGPLTFGDTYGGIIGLGNSNLGGSYNVTENVLIRCNSSVMGQGYIDAYNGWPNGTFSLENAAQGDDNPDAARLCQVSYNTMSAVTVEYNDFETTGMTIRNLSVGDCGQVGVENNFTGLDFHDNVIKSVSSLKIQNLGGTSNTEAVASGTFSGITISDNSITALKKTGWSADSNINDAGEQSDFGLVICCAGVANYDESNWDEAGSNVPLQLVPIMKNLTVESNSVSGFANGIAVLAADCGRTHFVTDALIENITLQDNVIVTDNLNANCNDEGIVIAGARDGGFNCVVSGAAVLNNDVTSFEGIIACGLLGDGMHLRANVSNNRVENLSICDNSCTCYAKAEPKKGVGLLTADMLMGWNELSAFPEGCGVSLTANSGNIYTGYPVKELVMSRYSDAEHSPSGAPASAERACRYFNKAYADCIGKDSARISCQWIDSNLDSIEAPADFGQYCYSLTFEEGNADFRIGNYHRIIMCYSVGDIVEPLVFENPRAEISDGRLNWYVEEIDNGTATLFIAGYSNGKMMSVHCETVSNSNKSGSIAAADMEYRLFFVGSGFKSLWPPVALQ